LLLSERRRAEEALVQLAAIERKKHELVNAVSHELRTPLTTIKGFIELIAGGDAGPVTDTQREFLEVTARSTDRLAALIDDLLGSVSALTPSSRGSEATDGPSSG
jgi:signal transduction histidine kinase